jgi:hypothetical protein
MVKAHLDIFPEDRSHQDGGYPGVGEDLRNAHDHHVFSGHDRHVLAWTRVSDRLCILVPERCDAETQCGDSLPVTLLQSRFDLFFNAVARFATSCYTRQSWEQNVEFSRTELSQWWGLNLKLFADPADHELVVVGRESLSGFLVARLSFTPLCLA